MATYTHDEARAELAKHGIKYTRKEMMNGTVSYREYMAQFVDDGVIGYVLRGIGRKAILNSKDEHFNDIPLAKWDALCGVLFFGSQISGKLSFPNSRLIGLANLTTYADGRSYSPCISPSDGIGVLKAAARKIKEDSKPRRDWTQVGKEAGYSGTEEADAKISAAIERLQWLEVESNREVPAMPGMAINEAIKQLRMPKVTHYAISNELAPYGFVGIRAHYINGTVQAYLVDAGDVVTPVCMDFEPVAEAATV
jgi:hypothetical protein